MSSRKIDDLVRQLNKLKITLKEIGISEEVLDREVKSFGNGGHVVLPKEHLNKKVKVIIN